MSRSSRRLALIVVLALLTWQVLAQVPVAPTNVTVNAQLALPAILGLSASSGPVGQGVIIHGANFGQIQGASTVRFNGTLATVTGWTIDTLTTAVPAGATTGTVVVLVAGHSSNGSPFTVTPPAPAVVTITSPTAGTTYDAGTASTLTTLAGTASSAPAAPITSCTWTNSLGGSGTAGGTTSWAVASIALTIGSNVLTVTCANGAPVPGTDVLTVTRSAPPPTVTITVPTSSPTYDAGTASALTLSGTATSAGSLTGCAWTNSLGGSGSTSGTTTWSVTSLPLTVGSNVVTVTCTDATSQNGTDGITITRSVGGGGGTNPIASSRLPSGSQTLPDATWAAAGATIVNRSTICTTLAAGASFGTINTAIQACASGGVVKLGAGSFSLAGAINLKSGVTLRGTGANSTFLTFTSNSGTLCAFAGVMCFPGDAGSYMQNNVRFSVNWTVGYTKGTTQITLADASNAQVGYTINLDQLNNNGADPYPALWYCATQPTCLVAAVDGGGEGEVRPGRQLTESVRIVAKVGNVLTIEPPLMHDWSAGLDPEAWFGNTTGSGVGVEDLSVQCNDQCGYNIFDMMNLTNSWIARVRSIQQGPSFCRAHVFWENATFNTVRDSYFFSAGCHGATSYGIETQAGGMNLIENNVFQWIVAPVMFAGGGAGSVAAYNFTVNQDYTAGPTFDFAGLWNHGAGGDFILYEGNDTEGYNADIQHGAGNFVTIVRNHFWGRELAHTDSTFAFNIRPLNRFHNYLGNVLGTSGYHTQYECYPGTCLDENHSIYWLGNGYAGSGISGPGNDSRVRESLFRWGNCDIVTGTNDTSTNDTTACRFVSAEVPSAIGGAYPNTVPATQTVPTSLYKSAKPSFFKASDPWPLVGPDVTSGTITNLGGHANPNPARQCYLSVMSGSLSGTTVLPFTCTYPLP